MYIQYARKHTYTHRKREKERVEKEWRDREKPTQQRQILTVIYEAISLRRFLFCFSLFAFHPLCNLNNMVVKMLDSIFFFIIIDSWNSVSTSNGNTNTLYQHPVFTHSENINLRASMQSRRLASALSKMEMKMITIVDNDKKWSRENEKRVAHCVSVELTTLKYCYCVNILRRS